jgi:aldehyde dehydrogenase (NAD+)
MSTTTPARLDLVQAWLGSPKRHYIGGEWSGTGSTATINPANGKQLATIAEATVSDVDQAVAAARAAFVKGEWRKMAKRDRARVMRKMADVVREHAAELATIEALDNGKLYREALDDMPDCADVLDYYAGWVDKYAGETLPVDGDFVNYTVREPVGVCALIVPWNFPLLLALWKIAPALATGNVVIVKPSPFTSLSTVRLFELWHEHLDLPPGLVNMVLGGVTAGQALTTHAGVDKVSFTGSSATGKRIVKAAADSNLKTVTLELGGKSPNIVFADTPDLEFAMARSFQQMFAQKGEKCSEPTRFYVQDAVYDRFVAYMVERANAVRCGDPFDPASDQGAQCNREQFDKIMEYIESGKAEGATLAAGGTRDVTGANRDGLFIRPTIFTDVTSTMRIVREEIFGPVVTISRFKDEDEAVALANDTDYGLAAGVWTADVSRAHRVAQRLDAGMVFVNRYGCYDFASPFGGFKQSGWGKEMASHSLDAYTKTKSVWIKI